MRKAVNGSVYGQGAQHRFLGPMCCDVHKRHSPSRAHICGGGESGLDPRDVQPPHVALTPSRAPQDLPPSPGFKKKDTSTVAEWPRAPRRRCGTPRFWTAMARLQMRRLISI